jgi:hypothetical protein
VFEENFRTHLSLTNAAVPEPFPSMKELVEEVLTAEGYSDKRAANMDINDFTCLLAAFNAKGIHFS